jgi:hypothetical protein
MIALIFGLIVSAGLSYAIEFRNSAIRDGRSDYREFQEAWRATRDQVGNLLVRTHVTHRSDRL